MKSVNYCSHAPRSMRRDVRMNSKRPSAPAKCCLNECEEEGHLVVTDRQTDQHSFSKFDDEPL